jgi:hypothetical protein
LATRHRTKTNKTPLNTENIGNKTQDEDKQNTSQHRKHWQQDTGRRRTKHLSTQKTLATRHRTKTNKTPLNTENIGNKTQDEDKTKHLSTQKTKKMRNKDP